MCRKRNSLYGLGHENNGIVHVIAPELGITQPGMTMVCGDSHTSTHGAFGHIAFGIGTSQVAQVFASSMFHVRQTKKIASYCQWKTKKRGIPKDVIYYIISKLGTILELDILCEYAGNVFEKCLWKANDCL